MKVFLVEDSKLILEHLRDMLSACEGVQLAGEADTEQDAMGGIAETRPDLVILDLSLAHGSGLEVLRQTRQSLPATAVVVLSNRVGPQYERRCLALGAERFLDKTRDFGRLRTVVEAFARRLVQGSE
ncbi:MAG TPA: response regulator [Noviherbaspirillum sp.]|uniref:response regulator n=1 Tax=Noviherbaspirillum sp. TaxID=1926288 RepID=UPI002D547925|nr:response regulator [Noviherbaspirillum sp.]HYD94494.1 response regulator [Noviherbaspirillum sp.]